MTGFQRKPKIIEFPEEHEFHGLVVMARRPNVHAIEAVYTVMGADTERSLAAEIGPLIDDVFGPALLSWNYHDEEGVAVPANADGLRQVDVEVLLEILQGWVDAASPSAELGKESASGRSSRERLTDGLPTVTNPTLSAALLSLPTHNASSAPSSASPVTP